MKLWYCGTKVVSYCGTVVCKVISHFSREIVLRPCQSAGRVECSGVVSSRERGREGRTVLAGCTAEWVYICKYAVTLSPHQLADKAGLG